VNIEAGVLIINADDWGRDCQTTDRTLECVRCGTVSAVSAMMLMKDSERAARIAREQRIDAGLHLNFTTPFSEPGVSSVLLEHQHRLSSFLRASRLAQVVFHPGLVRSFRYVLAAQQDEFRRLYGAEPRRYDGHHHMHLCANVLVGRLLPAGVVVRRNFSFQPGEKWFGNHLYRRAVDSFLARRYCLTDYFFSLAPLEPPNRLQTILSLARDHTVEVETHPIAPEEYRFLAGGKLLRNAPGDLLVAPRFLLGGHRQQSAH